MPPNDDPGAEALVQAAFAARDAGLLVRLYTAEADRLAAAGEVDAACFCLTQAYIWALEAGMVEAESLHARLAAEGREA